MIYLSFYGYQRCFSCQGIIISAFERYHLCRTLTYGTGYITLPQVVKCLKWCTVQKLNMMSISLSVWSSGMIPALGAGGPGFKPRNGPLILGRWNVFFLTFNQPSGGWISIAIGEWWLYSFYLFDQQLFELIYWECMTSQSQRGPGTDI